MNPYIGKAGKPINPIKRCFIKTLLSVQSISLVPSSIRIKMLRLCGVQIGKNCFIGTDVSFDTMFPEMVSIGNHVKITSGTKIITHFFNPYDQGMYLGKVVIQDEVFIGLNTLIVIPATIGEGAVLGAGSVVVKDVPSWEIWGGNPARFIKKRVSKDKKDG